MIEPFPAAARLSAHAPDDIDVGNACAADPSLPILFDRAWPPAGWSQCVHSGAAVVLVDQLEWTPWLDEARSLLDRDEWARVERRRRPCDRDSLVLAYALHRLLLSSLLRIPPSSVQVGRDAKGCPRLPGDVLWTSLSHGDRHLAFAFSGVGPIGVDIESSGRAAELPAIIERVCTPGETASAGQLDDASRAAWLLALWVRKEAYLKAVGIGLEWGMETFDAAEGAVLPLPQPEGRAGPDQVQVSTLRSGPGCIAAVAMVPGAPFANHWLRPVDAAGVAGLSR